MPSYLHKKRFSNARGLNFRSTEFALPENFAAAVLNAQYRKDGRPEKRKGFHAYGLEGPKYGIFEYRKADVETGETERFVIGVSETAYRLVEAQIVVVYGGSDPNASISIFFDPTAGEYRCVVEEGDDQVLNVLLGIGIDESDPVTIPDLASQISAIPGFNATASANSAGIPAAFIKPVRTHDLNDTLYQGLAGYWEELNTTATLGQPFFAFHLLSSTNRIAPRLMSAVQIGNLLYISNGLDEVHKFDGQTLYRAGLPRPASVSAEATGDGPITGTNYRYLIRYVQKDAAGEFWEGNHQISEDLRDATDNYFKVTVSNILAGSGFNTNCAIVDGQQLQVNEIAVNDGGSGFHTMKAGDTAYFFDWETNDYVERKVLSVTDTAITVDGEPVSVESGDVISNNLRIEIYRSKTSATEPELYFLVSEIPNNSFSLNTIFEDWMSDDALGPRFVEPLTDRSPPRKGAFISNFRGHMMIGGIQGDRNVIDYSDVDGAEYHPADSHSLRVTSPQGDSVNGMAPDEDLFYAFGSRSIHSISGDLESGNITVRELPTAVGCTSHSSIGRLTDGRIVFMSERGPYSIKNGANILPLGYDADEYGRIIGGRIEPVFDQDGVDEDAKLQVGLAIGTVDLIGERYMLYVPAVSQAESYRYFNQNSRLFVYDFARDAWLEWSNMNFGAGVVISGGEMYFAERTFSGGPRMLLYRRNNSGDREYDYEDHNVAIPWEWLWAWETLGEPGIAKKFLKARPYFTEEEDLDNGLLEVAQQVNFVPETDVANMELGFTGVGYGLTPYGRAPYGDPVEPVKNLPLRRGRYKALRFKFSNQEHHRNVVLPDIELEAAAPYKPIFKK